jgi:hypothetical protein
MPNYSLVFVGEGKSLSTSALNKADALSQFSKQLGYILTEDENDTTTDLLMDEWEVGPHWVNPTIPVFRK